MPGDFRQLHWRITQDQDWRTVPRLQQHTYLMLLAHPKLNAMGVIDRRIEPMIDWAPDWEIDDLRAELAGLEERRYVFHDPETIETLVRSYVRWDGHLKVPNSAVSVANAWLLIESPRLKDVAFKELCRAYRDDATLAGWRGVSRAQPDLMDAIIAEIGEAHGNPSRNGRSNPARKGSRQGSH